MYIFTENSVRGYPLEGLKLAVPEGYTGKSPRNESLCTVPTLLLMFGMRYQHRLSNFVCFCVIEWHWAPPWTAWCFSLGIVVETPREGLNLGMAQQLQNRNKLTCNLFSTDIGTVQKNIDLFCRI